MLKIATLTFLLAFSSACYSQALVEVSISFSDGVGGSSTLIAGLDPAATDGQDVGLGETVAPPLPPAGAYDVRFTLPGSPVVQTFKDIRTGDNTVASIGEKEHTVNFQLGTGSTGLQVSWNLPFGVALNLQDPFGFLFDVNVDKQTSGSYTIPNSPPPYNMLTSFYLTVKYIDPAFPVELTSFCANILNEKVELSWKTATEVNNYGFEIEKKSAGSEWQNIGFVPGNGNCNSPKEYSFSDKNLNGVNKFQYRLRQIDYDGAFEYSSIVEVEVLPKNFSVYQNYPNPFNPSTTIKFSVSNTAYLKINIYNTAGEKVLTAAEGKFEPGFYNAEINAANLPSGIYVYRLESEDFMMSRKMVLIK